MRGMIQFFRDMKRDGMPFWWVFLALAWAVYIRGWGRMQK